LALDGGRTCRRRSPLRRRRLDHDQDAQRLLSPRRRQGVLEKVAPQADAFRLFIAELQEKLGRTDSRRDFIAKSRFRPVGKAQRQEKAMAPLPMLEVLILGGLMGLLGQGARSVVGLKKMVDDANVADLSPNDLFQAARLLVSLMIGFLVGVAAALIHFGPGADATTDMSKIDWHVMIGFASAGYAGTDILEGFMNTYLTPVRSNISVPAGPKQSINAKINELAVAIPINAKQFVYSVLREALPTARPTDTTKLSDLGFGPSALSQLAGRINVHKWHGVVIDNLTESMTVADLINVVVDSEKASADKARGES
jgi:hypothetical protein